MEDAIILAIIVGLIIVQAIFKKSISGLSKEKKLKLGMVVVFLIFVAPNIVSLFVTPHPLENAPWMIISIAVTGAFFLFFYKMIRLKMLKDGEKNGTPAQAAPVAAPLPPAAGNSPLVVKNDLKADILKIAAALAVGAAVYFLINHFK